MSPADSPAGVTPAGSSAIVPNPATPAEAPPPPGIHDAAQLIRFLGAALQSDKIPLGCFLGAGCPLGVYDFTGQNSLSLIPDVAHLTSKVQTDLTATDAAKEDGDKLIPLWGKLVSACKEGGIVSPNVE